MFTVARQVKKPYPTLYHLSFNPKLEGRWSPQLPDGDGLEVTDPTLHQEPDTARISLSPTVDQCFQAIYANVKHLFDDAPDKTLTFNVYQPVFTGKERIVTPDTLSRHRLIHDAHITEEHCVLDPLKMVWTGTATIKAPRLRDVVMYRAFGDKGGEIYGSLPYPIHVVSLSLEAPSLLSSNW
jgi:hypothetical protein